MVIALNVVVEAVEVGTGEEGVVEGGGATVVGAFKKNVEILRFLFSAFKFNIHLIN